MGKALQELGKVRKGAHERVSQEGYVGVPHRSRCMRGCKWLALHEHRGAGGGWGRLTTVTCNLPAGFPIDFLGKLTGKIVNGDHRAL